MMDDLSSKEITDHPKTQINDLITKIQALSNFSGFDISIFEQIRKEFVNLPSYLVKEASQPLTRNLMSITIDFLHHLNYQSISSNQTLFLRNILSLLYLMGFKASKMDASNINEIFISFSSFIKVCDRSLLPLVLHVFYHILDDNDQEGEQIRQQFLKYFIPSFASRIKSFLPIFSTDMNLPETTFFIQSIEFLLRLSIQTYNAIQKDVDQLLLTLLQFLNISPAKYPEIKNFENILLIQSKIIKIFITYNQLTLPIKNFKIEMVIPNLLNILNYVDPSYFYTIRDILLNLILIMRLKPENTNNFIQLLNNLPLFCKFSRYNQSVIDSYTIFVINIYERSFKLQLITDQSRVHLFLFMMNILHYQGVSSFIRHNEFVQLQQHIPIKGNILFLYNYSFDVDFIKSIRNLSKYYNTTNDIDSLKIAYDKSSNIIKSVQKIFKILSSNLQIIFERYRSNSSSLIEVTSKYNICNTKLLIITLCDAMYFVVRFHHLMNFLSTIVPEVSKTTTINQFYEIERKMINISVNAENCEKAYSTLLNDLVNIFSIIPMNFVCNIWDIFLKKLFDQNEVQFEKSFITAFSQKGPTLIPLIDSYFSFIIPQFQTCKNVKNMFSITLFIFQVLNDVEIDSRISTSYQQLLRNHALRLIYIMKEDYVISVKHSSDALNLISNVITFIDRLEGSDQFSFNLINNNNFLRSICQSFQCISISPVDSIQFIDFCFSVSDKSITLPYVLDILISSLDKCPDLAIPLLNKAAKISKKAVYQHPMSSLLFQSSAYLLNRIEKSEDKKILLKFLKHSTQNSISNINRIPNDILDLKKIVFKNTHEDIKFTLPLSIFIEKLKKTMKQSPKNEMLYEIMNETIICIFASDDLTFDNRKIIMSLFSFIFSFYENEEDLVYNCIKRIFNQSEGNFIVYAHAFVSICSNFQDLPHNLLSLIVSSIKSVNDFSSFVNEILILSYSHLLPSKSVMHVIIQTLIENIECDLIDPISLALLGYEYLSSNSISFGIKNEYKNDGLTTFSELGYLPHHQIEIIIFIRDLLGKSSLSLARLFNLIPSLSVFPQIILFEFMSKCKCNDEILSFFEKYINDKSLDGAQQARLVGLTLRAFPEIVTLKSDKILDLLSNLESSYLMNPSNSASMSSPTSSTASLSSCSPSSSLSSLPSFFASSSINTFSSGTIERQQEGNILLILNVLLTTNPKLVNNGANYFNSVVRFLTSNNLFYRHQARIGIKNFFEIKNNEIDLMINISHKEYMHRINFPEDIYESTFIDFSACYEYLMIFFPIYHNTIFATIIKYLKHIESSFVVNREDPQNHLQKKPEKHKINQDIFIKSLLSLFSFFSNRTVIQLLVSEGYMIQLLPYVAFVYCTFVFQRDRIFDNYILKMLEEAPEQFIEFINNSSTHPHCLDFFVIFLENEKAFEIMKNYENEIKLNLSFEQQQQQQQQNISSIQNAHKDKLPINYYLSVTAILTLFGKDIEKAQQCLLSHIDLFKSNIRHFEPFMFSKIMSNFASNWPKLFLLIVFHIIEADSPLLLAHCRTIFSDNINSFNEEIFDDLEYDKHSDLVNESFFNYIIVHYISKRPNSLEHFMNLVNNTQTAYVIASFYLFLQKKKIIIPEKFSLDALELFNKCGNYKARLKTLLYWSKFNKCSDFLRMFKNLESFISLYFPSEVFDCLLNLKVPDDVQLPSSYFDVFPFFYNQEATSSTLLSLVSKNYEQVKYLPEFLKQDLLMNLEFSFDSPNSRITDSIALFDGVFLMIHNKEDETLIHRCKGYISKTISIVKIYPGSSRTFLKLMLQNAFKIIKLYKKDDNESSDTENEDDESVSNRLLFDEILTFFNYMFENSRNAPVIQVLAYFLPDLTELLVQNDDESNAENLLSQIVDLDSQIFWPYVMRALNIISEFNSIYERIVEFRSNSLVTHSLPIIWESSKEKIFKQVDITIDFCSLKPKSRVDILLQNICMIYMTRKLRSTISFYLSEQIYKSVDIINENKLKEIEKSKELIYKVLKFGIKSDKEVFVQELLKLFDNKKILKIYFERNNNQIEDEILSQLSIVALLNGCNLYMDKYPSYVDKVFSELPYNYYVKVSELFAPVFRMAPEKAIGLVINLDSKLKFKSISTKGDVVKALKNLSKEVVEDGNASKPKKRKRKRGDMKKEEAKKFEASEEEENKEEDEKSQPVEPKEEEEQNDHKNEEEEENIEEELVSIFNEDQNLKFPTTGVSLKTSFECLENLSYWNLSNLKSTPEFAFSFEQTLPPYLFYSHFSLKEKAEESIVSILDDPAVTLSQIEKIINEPNFDSLLNFVTENIRDPDSVLNEHTNVLAKMRGILDSSNYLNYLIIQTLKCPLEMICKGSTTFPPHAFELKLSPTILPKYHSLYTKVRETFLTAFSVFKNISDKNDGGIASSLNENKTLLNLINKFKSIHEKHIFEEQLSIANFNGDEVKFSTQERDIERIITAVFISSLKKESDEIIDATISTLEKGLKLNPSNDVFLTILSSKYKEIDSEKLEGLLNLIKNVPFRWSPKFIDLIIKEEDIFKTLLSKIHRGLYISLVENGVEVPHDVKKLVNSYLNPLHNIIRSEKCKTLKMKIQAEKEILKILRRKTYGKKLIPNEIKQVLINYKNKEIDVDEKTEDEDTITEDDTQSNEEEETNDTYNDIVNDHSLSFFFTSHLPSPPPPLVDDSNAAISMACYMKKKDDKFMVVTILLNNGSTVNYLLAPIEIGKEYSLFCSLVTKVLMSDQHCCLQSQIIESMMSVKLKGGFTLVNANDAEPLYRYSLLKKLYVGAKAFFNNDEKEKTKKNVEPQNIIYTNEFFYNFTQKESYIKWFYHFGSRYAAISIIQAFLDILTPSPTEVFINMKTASPLLSTISTHFSISNARFSFIRMCGKMRKFCSKFMLNGPFRDGLISAATCFVVNQHKISLFLDSILHEIKKDPFTFLKRCAGLSIHHSSSDFIQENTNNLIEKSYNDQKIFIIPWL